LRDDGFRHGDGLLCSIGDADIIRSDPKNRDPARERATKQLQRKLEYDGFGNVWRLREYSVAGGIGTARTTTFAFDATNPQFLDSVTVVDPVGGNLTTLLDFDPLLGLQTSVTGPDGLTTTSGYDAFGRLTLEDPPGGSTTVSYRKCATGGCFAPNAAFYVQAADSTGATAYTFFDVLGRPVGSDAPLAGSRRSREQVVYRADGQVDKSALPYVAGEGVHWVTMTYDTLGRTLTEDDEDTGAATRATYAYLGHELKVTAARATRRAMSTTRSGRSSRSSTPGPAIRTTRTSPSASLPR
jgi:YD repeat-containing protein